ncbi:unnamed protein product [Vicia faba]|uniref:Uncharacterized protein n=1 Tax=Vicia faba TaxID=3906 RepID=A0AAV0Z0R1_VICFA|nr:unnamed protein product [Vicia faba]
MSIQKPYSKKDIDDIRSRWVSVFFSHYEARYDHVKRVYSVLMIPILRCCAVFGTEIRPTTECGRTMYIIRQRIDLLLLMRMQKKHEASGFKGQTSYKNVKRKQVKKMETSIFSQVDIDADEISHLDEDNLIGHGGNRKVYRITLKKNRMVVVVKQLEKDGFYLFCWYTWLYFSRNAKYEEALE